MSVRDSLNRTIGLVWRLELNVSLHIESKLGNGQFHSFCRRPNTNDVSARSIEVNGRSVVLGFVGVDTDAAS